MVLPLPDSPTIPRISPALTRSETPSTIAPPPPRNSTRRSSRTRASSVIAVPRPDDRPSVRAIASPMRFTAIVSAAMSAAGARITSGLRSSPERFSLIISAQSDDGGWSPRPRKFTDATRMIEYVKRSPMSAIIAGRTFGSSSRRTIAPVRSPRAIAASTKPRTDCSAVAVRTMRATRGAWTSATPTTSTHALDPSPVASTRRKISGGNESATSAPRISIESVNPLS